MKLLWLFFLITINYGWCWKLGGVHSPLQLRKYSQLKSDLRDSDVEVGGKVINTDSLRRIEVKNLQNQVVSLDIILGKADTAIVVYLRHLG